MGKPAKIEKEFEECLKGAGEGKRIKVIGPENEQQEISRLASEAAWKIQSSIINYRSMLYDSAIINLQFASSMLVDIALIRLQGIKPENHHCRIVCINKFLGDTNAGRKYSQIMEMKTDAAYVKGSEQDRLTAEAKGNHIVRFVEELGKKLKSKWNLKIDFETPEFGLTVEGRAVGPPVDLLSKLRGT